MKGGFGPLFLLYKIHFVGFLVPIHCDWFLGLIIPLIQDRSIEEMGCSVKLITIASMNVTAYVNLGFKLLNPVGQ
jgi:hypothetical protein